MPPTLPPTLCRGLRPVLAVALVATLAGCLPDTPSAGRSTPVRRVLVVGDSITHGLFGTSPRVDPALRNLLGPKGITVSVDGYPAENPLDIWPDHPRWVERMAGRILTENPDVVIIQSILFQEAEDATRQQLYRAAVRELFDVAKSRGAHVYIVAHHTPRPAKERSQMAIAQRIQAEEAAARGISRIPLDVWIGGCKQPFLTDGWHLNDSGQRCHADALHGAVQQLVNSLR